MPRSRRAGSTLRWLMAAVAVAGRLARFPIRLDHAGLRRDRPSVLRGPAPGARFAARRSSCSSAGISRSARYCSSLGLALGALARAGTAGAGWRSSASATRFAPSIWICGGNLPLVPGDSCHYLEVATSVLRGEGPVKHYVESFFRDYPRDPRGPRRARRLGHAARRLRARAWPSGSPGSGRMLRSRRGSPPPRRAASSSTCWRLPALYVFARRRYGCRVALWTMAVLAMLPVHAIYAGFVLRESLVALTSILAVWTLTEVWQAGSRRRAVWAWAVAAGLCGGLAVLARTTALALLAAAGLFALVAHGRQTFGPLLLWGVRRRLRVPALGLGDCWEYGQPFYSYTSYFEYNFSWTVHHYEKGNTLRLAVLHGGEPAGDRPGEDQVAADHRRLLDDDRRAADRRWASARRLGARKAPAARPTSWSRRSSWCSCWRRSRASPT